jgi:hypothetical protein
MCDGVRHRIGYTEPHTGMLAEKILSTSCIGFLVAVMSAMNDEFRDKLVELANGGLWERSSSLATQALRWTSGLTESVGMYGGDHNWLLITALGGAVVLVAWVMRW